MILYPFSHYQSSIVQFYTYWLCMVSLGIIANSQGLLQIFLLNESSRFSPFIWHTSEQLILEKWVQIVVPLQNIYFTYLFQLMRLRRELFRFDKQKRSSLWTSSICLNANDIAWLVHIVSRPFSSAHQLLYNIFTCFWHSHSLPQHYIGTVAFRFHLYVQCFRICLLLPFPLQHCVFK